ncbi:MAG: aspartyl/asparaginyl beta-hydroxylase domain-containing protein [Arenimonas sp.]
MKLPVPFLQLPLRFDAAALAAEVLAIEESCWRPHPNGLPGNSALTLITTGGIPESDNVCGPMRPTAHLTRCPYLMQVLSSVGGTWGRTRLMRLSGHAEVTPHVDINYYWRERVRVHVPIITQPTVRFSCGEAQINMAAGECWIFDTWRAHHVVNDSELSRIHLVADTVGGEGFWNLVNAGKPSGREIDGWTPRTIAPVADARPALDYESVNLPVVMTPWEMREHIIFMLGEAEPHPNLAAMHQLLLRLSRHWQALWSCYGEDLAGLPRYRELLDKTQRDLRAQSAGIVLKNGISFAQAITSCVTEVALQARRPDSKRM